jgi:hypothetical protein
VAWGKNMSRVIEGADAAAVVAAHHEGNSLEVYATATASPGRRPRLRAVT